MTDLILGLDTFGDVPVDGSGAPLSYAAAIRQVVDEAVLADELGVDVIALGEHHRPEYSISTPETVLAGIATRTERIKLGSGVTVLSSDDPVRVHQRFAPVARSLAFEAGPACRNAHWGRGALRLMLQPFGGGDPSRDSGNSARMRRPKLRRHTSPSPSGPGA